jgi:hypothetical protein
MRERRPREKGIMDTTRYEALTAKRDDVGLSDDEADELGRMAAELGGRTYENADTVSAEGDEAPAEGSLERSCGHLQCGCQTDEQFCSSFCRDHSTEVSEAGPEFDCGCEHDACKAVVGQA